MKIRQAVLPIALGLALLVAGCDSRSSTTPQPIAKADNLQVGAQLDSCIGVAIADMGWDSILDIVSVSPNGIKYFEGDGKGGYFDRGVIAKIGAQLNSGIGIAVADLDRNGINDIVIASPNGIRIFKNPISQKK